MVDEAPGTPVYDLAVRGSVECKDESLADVIAKVHRNIPDLADIDALYRPEPNRGGDGNLIYAFQHPQGGFALVFVRGSGDCPSGCISHEYWYFDTVVCIPLLLGRYVRDGSQQCIPADQRPQWGIPPAPPPGQVCDADMSARDVSGEYDVAACGTARACAVAGETTERTLPATLHLSVQQSKTLEIGSVTLQGTGEPLLDGRALPASFSQRSFAVEMHESSDDVCVEHFSLSFHYDFDDYGTAPRSLALELAHTPNCQGSGGDYCKGNMQGSFGSAQRMLAP